MEKTIADNYWTLRIDLLGGRIIELKYLGDTVLGTFDRIDGKKGNTHLCLPNFGAEGQEKYDLPFHGPSRSVLWEVAGATFPGKNSLAIRCFLPQTSAYKAELSVVQEFRLEKELFCQAITVENLLGEQVPVNIGIHNYWDAPAGWEGTLLNGEDITKKVMENGFSPVKTENDIILPGGRSYKWNLEGFRDTVLWTGRKDGSFDTTYVCIEPALRYSPSYFGSAESMLMRGKAVSASQQIRPRA